MLIYTKNIIFNTAMLWNDWEALFKAHNSEKSISGIKMEKKQMYHYLQIIRLYAFIVKENQPKNHYKQQVVIVYRNQ